MQLFLSAVMGCESLDESIWNEIPLLTGKSGRQLIATMVVVSTSGDISLPVLIWPDEEAWKCHPEIEQVYHVEGKLSLCNNQWFIEAQRVIYLAIQTSFMPFPARITGSGKFFKQTQPSEVSVQTDVYASSKNKN